MLQYETANLRYSQGHYAVLFTNAIDVEVYGFTSSSHKVDDTKKLGVHHVVVTDGKGELAKDLAFELDLNASMKDVVNGFPLTNYMM
jgi:D-arabinose 1-dehydrogenase-like Zn-dependent alcohol dehydrogenase